VSNAPSAAVLRNKGIAVEVQKLDNIGEPVYDENGEPRTEERHVRFTINVMAQLETAYRERTGLTSVGYTAWQELLRIEPVNTMRHVFSLMWKLPEPTVGEMLMVEHLANYATALSAAFAIAEGVDPQMAMAAIKERVDAAVAADLSRFPTTNGDSPESS
jgi:hypothetical protein